MDDLFRAKTIASFLSYYTENLILRVDYIRLHNLDLPSQYGSELASAMAHVLRANQTKEQAQLSNQIDIAIAHLQQAGVSCGMVVIQHQVRLLDDLINNAKFHHGFLTPDIKSKYRNIKGRSRHFRDVNLIGELDSLNQQDILLTDITELTEKITADYQVAWYKMSSARRWLSKWSSPFFLIAGPIITGILTYVFKPQLDDLVKLIGGVLRHYIPMLN